MGESGKALRNWRALYRAALFETDTSKLTGRIDESAKHSRFDPESCLQILPIMMPKPRTWKMPSMLSKPWRIVCGRIQKTADTRPEPDKLRKLTRSLFPARKKLPLRRSRYDVSCLFLV